MTEQAWRLFIEHQFGDDIPEWIPYLPKPGEFTHRVYGKKSFTQESNASIVNNFKSGIYQKQLPVDGEHLLKQSGALGYIKDMRMNEDGSADAHVDWTERGKIMVGDKRFRYVSPEYYPQWQDPATDIDYTDIAIGAALTSRPFFKESHLRPLIANEQGLFAAEGEINSTDTTFVFMQLGKEQEMADKPQQDNVTPQAFAELQTQFAEMKQALAESEQQRTEAEGKAQTYQEALDATNQRIAKMEDAARTKRFTELADGHDGSRWLGDVAKHVKVMRGLTEAFGEDAEELSKYVAQQQAVAAQVKDSELFKELGSDKTASKAKSASEELDALTKEYMKSATDLTYAQAYAEVLERNPAVYQRHRNGE